MQLFVIDAFTNRPFAGNPAAVCLLPEPADEGWMQLVAREMQLSETAFLHPIAGVCPALVYPGDRGAALWACHAGQRAYVVGDGGAGGRATGAFQHAQRVADLPPRGAWISMDFPALSLVDTPPPAALLDGLRVEPLYVGASGYMWLVEVADAVTVREAQPDFGRLAEVPGGYIILTARSDRPEYDFLSRFFAPAAGVNEDPVTGSSHCALGPYWQGKLGKSDFTGSRPARAAGWSK